MRAFYLLPLVALLPTRSTAQGIPDMEWQACFGGSGFEAPYGIRQAEDGGYIFLGETRSDNGQVVGFHGNVDFWVVRTDASGTLLWQRALGGTDFEFPRAIIQTMDGGIVVAGSTDSNDGDLTGVEGSGRAWVIKLFADGAIQWQHRYAGSFWAIEQTDDGALVLAGGINSTLNIPGCNQGGPNAWLVKLDSTGAMLWERCYGGSSMDLFLAMDLTEDGGCVLAGWSLSNDGDVSSNNGGFDMWVVKVDQQGELQWEKSLGGSNMEYANAVRQADDGGYMAVGFTRSTDGDVTGHHGQDDVWVVKLDAAGNLIWQRAIGGSDREVGNDVLTLADGGFTVAGWTQSMDGDVSQLAGEADAWLIRLDADGTLLWEKTFGGTGSELFRSIIRTSDGGFAFGGGSNSNDGDVSGHHGGGDLWLVKLGPETVGIPDIRKDPLLSLFPNPTRGTIGVELLMGEAATVGCTWFDASGRTLRTESTTHYPTGYQQITLNTEGLPTGPLLLQLQIGEKRVMRRVVKL